MKRMIYYTSTEKNATIQAVESGTTFDYIDISNIVVFVKQKEAEAFVAKRDGNKKKASRKFW